MVFARADFPRAMSTLQESNRPGFGLSLPRMFLWLDGKDPRRAERSAIEAYAVGTFMYLLSYLSAAQLILQRIDSAALRLAGLILLLVIIWLFWLLLLYVNSILILLLRRIGLHKGLSNTASQSVLLTTLATIFAFYLARDDSWMGWLGLGWMFLVFLNLVSIALLRCVYGRASV